MLSKEQRESMLKDVAWVEKLGDSMPMTVRDICCHIKALLSDLEEADSVTAHLNLLLLIKEQALDVFASKRMWLPPVQQPQLWAWLGAADYANPMTFAAKERDRQFTSDSIGSVTHTMSVGQNMIRKNLVEKEASQ